ncbi:zinc-binding dehydrogenase [Mesorhizobium sp.]|uniref:quinone oxidoreductase family protein n=1 Tax=Mesorhizobium sp. TaxID=1871066 RepID=UPI000FE857A9|nr:zinc-binding dehydrogenase [Mesorhizobium sp.]RWM31003.1 MAG: zinc-binding alcohol dehydrogenase family protein [Mesorhizobium sp.]RWM41546.1 MAG: zinc-binding alcohol dehydrogenase family protein [Mesorhizobium sp.]TIO78699.1 MAG: zinc-binding alcohol dehydrogenase family protein [Mesorhizobium sp.]TIO87649.1 MAG: zinc-binding alcohol dehydrogenase family protein [Mesorhizobium sp.]TJV54240.1 MAG: zinc-binding alcohol dehydrogenase family protein [Mesorhizobium sp.]
MKAVQFSRFGGPEVLQVVNVPTPAAGIGEVLIRIGAAGINFFEALMRADRYAVTPSLPMFPGVEAAGTVEAVGEAVDQRLVGSRVAAPLFVSDRPFGGYAEYVTIDASLAIPLPDALSFEEATALMVQGLTALHLLRRSPPEHKSILVPAAAGGVGSLLLQLAKEQGARRIIALAGSKPKRDLAQSLGADAAVDHHTTDWVAEVRDLARGGVDTIYDTVGGAMTGDFLDVLSPGGELVFAALGRFARDAAELEAMIGRNQSLKGFALVPLLSPAVLKTSLSELFELAISGRLTVAIGGRFRLEQAAEAHRLLEERRSTGKVVLIP